MLVSVRFSTDTCPLVSIDLPATAQDNNDEVDTINDDNFDSVSGDIDRVSGAVDNNYDRNDNDKDEHVMPYDKDKKMCAMTQTMKIRQMTVIMIKWPLNMPITMRQP